MPSSKRTQRLLQQAADDYNAERKRVHAKMLRNSVGSAPSVAVHDLKTMHGAAVVGIFNGKGKGTSFVIHRDEAAEIGRTLLRIALAPVPADEPAKGGA